MIIACEHDFVYLYIVYYMPIMQMVMYRVHDNNVSFIHLKWAKYLYQFHRFVS